MPPVSRSESHLPALVTGPSYDLTSVTPGIVHIGLGGFHRAHFARYTHDLMAIDPSALAWGIIGTGLRPTDTALLSTLSRQDGLYTLVERDRHNIRRTLIGSIVETIDASKDSAFLLDAIARPTTRIVSVTVSEHGYHLDSATRLLNVDDPAIQRDLAAPHAPRTLPGILVESLRRRRAQGQAAFTAMSCDNIPHNGQILSRAVIAFARLSDPELANWIADHGAFPSSMVDRITPVPTVEEIAALAAETGVPDRAALFCETFSQWVIEDRFADGRPDWDRVGAQFVDDVAPYEAMKLRLLNASHLAIAGLGFLCGFETVMEAATDPLIRRFMLRLMDTETGPTLPKVPGIDVAAYKNMLIDRFANPAIKDTLQRINADAPINLLIDPLKDCLQMGAPIPLLALGLAAWCLRVKRQAASATDRPMGKAEALLQERARSQDTPLSFLSAEAIFGEVGRDPRLVGTVRSWLDSLEHMGVATTLKEAADTGLL